MQTRPTAIGLVLVAVLWGGTPAPASAQGSSGVLLGFNSAEMDFDVPDFGTLTFDRRTGFVGGIFLERTLQGLFGVEIDALFAQKGTTIDFDFAGEEPSVIKVDYLDIPVLARVNLGGSDAARVHLYAGPSFNIKLSESFEPDEDDDTEAESLEVGVVFGGGLTVRRVRVDVRYGIGLSRVFSEETLEAEGTVKNQVVSVLFGIALME